MTLKMHEGETEWVRRAFDVNATGTYLVAHYFVPSLLDSENGAKGFITIGRIAGCIRRGIIANTGYTVSKMAQTRLVEMLGKQYGEEGLVAVEQEVSGGGVVEWEVDQCELGYGGAAGEEGGNRGEGSVEVCVDHGEKPDWIPNVSKDPNEVIVGLFLRSEG